MGRPQHPRVLIKNTMQPGGVAILGSTGSIGCNTLRVIESLGRDEFQVVALAAGRNTEKLADQISRHQPELVSVENSESAARLEDDLRKLKLTSPRLVVGE